MKTALISVTDKTGIVDFARALIELGIKVISTGGTAKAIEAAGLPVTPIETVTGFPEMLDGRVKTLHPKIHGGLLALRENSEHMARCAEFQIGLIDIVVVNLYAFESTVSKPGVNLEEAIEHIDIGGPSMIRSAAKNYQSVAVVTNPAQYPTIIQELKNGDISPNTKFELAKAAFKLTASYDTAIAKYLESVSQKHESQFEENYQPLYKKIADLRYGENPHQSAAIYDDGTGTGLTSATQLHGKALSYNNYMDLDAAWQMAKAFPNPTVVIVKHANPCGAAFGETVLDAYKKALACDPVSAFGSIIGINRPVNADLAQEIANLFVEAVIAPSYDADALEILSKKPSIRLLSHPKFDQADTAIICRHIQGGLLRQSADSSPIDKSKWTTVSEQKASKDQEADLLFAFTLVKFIKSNAIVVVKGGQTLGIGAGQMSRVDAVEIALEKAGEGAKGAVVASDAVFPFRDSVDQIAKAGIAAIIQPGGSVRDAESIESANENSLVMIMTGQRHFRH